MVYKIAVIADIHWGAEPYQLMTKNLELFLEFIRQADVDMVVIAGDYFDYRLQLNSPTAIASIAWFDHFYQTCKKSNVKAIRIIKGTQEHDNEQLEVFRTYEEEDNDYLRIYNTTSSDEPLPGLRCVYCPDETMNLREYHMTYCDKFFPTPDIGFFHGNFDTILPSIEFDRIQDHNLKTMIYEYEKFSRLIKGPLISGHWHTAMSHESLYYVGSYDRWKFNEEEDKGFIYCEYDTESHQYYIHRIINPLAKKYDTIIIRDEDFKTPIQFADLNDIIRKKLDSDDDLVLRIQYIITDENPEAQLNFNAFTKKHLNNKRLKLDIKDVHKKQMKKEKQEATHFEADKYQYIFEKSMDIPHKVHQFILDKKGIDVSVEEIQNILGKYLENI